MDVLSPFAGVFDVVFGVLLPFVVVLGIVIFIHEFGHYAVGRWCGIHAEIFSVGFGPEIFGWTDRRGTRWRVTWIPLGGYVLFSGDADAASAEAHEEALAAMTPEERRRTLQGAPLWAKAATVAAGPIANFILTIVLIAGLLLVVGRVSDQPVLGPVAAVGQAAGAGLEEGDRILSIDGAPVDSFRGFLEAMLATPGAPREVEIERDGETLALPVSFARSTRVTGVLPGGPADLACIQPGDVILAVGGAPIASFEELQDAVTMSQGETLDLTIQRGGSEPKILALTPRLSEAVAPDAGRIEMRYMIGVLADPNLGVSATREPAGFLGALGQGLAAPYQHAAATFGYLGQIFVGQADGSSLGGPIGIARMSGQAADTGLIGFVVFIATISTAIGLINLFPIPILDGGHLVFYALEAVRGRPIGERAARVATTVGLTLIVALMIFATTNDLSGWVGGLSRDC